MRSQRGFSLVELMVALTLGLLLIGAVSAIFVGARNGYVTSSGISSQSDSARFSTDFLARALRSAGYIGCNAPPRTNDIFATESVLTGFAGNTFGGNPVSGYEASGSNPGQTLTLPATFAADNTATDWTPNLPTAPAALKTQMGLLGTAAGNVVSGSDILIVYGSQAGLTPAPVTNAGTGPSHSLTLPTGYATLSSLLPVGSLAVMSDCGKSTAFQITAVNDASKTITHSANSTMTMGNSTGTFPITFNSGFVYVPTTTFYYIGLGADGDAALFKSDLSLQSSAGDYKMVATELAPDVENMQVLYGVNPTAIRNGATSYVRADQVTGVCTDASWNCVVSVSVALLVSSPTGVVPVPSAAPQYTLLGTTVNAPQDTRQRQVYQVTVALRNALP